MKAFTTRDLMVTVVPEAPEHEQDLIQACKAGQPNCTTTCTNTVAKPKPKWEPAAEYETLQEQLESVLTE